MRTKIVAAIFIFAMNITSMSHADSIMDESTRIDADKALADTRHQVMAQLEKNVERSIKEPDVTLVQSADREFPFLVFTYYLKKIVEDNGG